MNKYCCVLVIFILVLSTTCCGRTKKRLRETSANLEGLVGVINGYLTDHGSIPTPYSKPYIGPLKIIRSQLEPVYIQAEHGTYWKDSWNCDIIYYAQPPRRFWLVSYGADCKRDENLYYKNGWPLEIPKRDHTPLPENDIILNQDWLAISWPYSPVAIFQFRNLQPANKSFQPTPPAPLQALALQSAKMHF